MIDVFVIARRRAALPTVLVFLALATGVAAQPTTPPKPEDAGARPSTEPRDVEVTLLEAGAEPRRTLRYAPGATAVRDLVATFHDSSTSLRDGEPAAVDPGIGETLHLRASSSAEGEEVARRYVVDRTELTTAPGISRRRLGMRREQLDAMTSLGFVLTDRGRGAAVGIETIRRPDTGPILNTLVRSFAERVATLVVPLPEEPVGPGARWQTSREVNVEGIRAQDVWTYRLEKIDGDSLVVRIDRVRAAEPQTVLPAAGAGAENLPPDVRRHLRYRLDEFGTVGGGTVRLRLDRPEGFDATYEATTRMKRRLTRGDEETVVEDARRTTLSIRPREVAEREGDGAE